MAKTAFLLFAVVLVFACTSYAGRLDDFLRRNKKRVKCRRGDESTGSCFAPPIEWYVSSIPKRALLAYAQNPGLKYRDLSFSPKGSLGNSPLRFKMPDCSGYALDPVAIGDEIQRLYVDTDGLLYMAEYSKGNEKYKPVRLHYDLDAKSVFVPSTRGEN